MSTQIGQSDENRVAASLAALFGSPVQGDPLAHSDGKTGARIERVVVGGEPYVLKYLHREDDWLMRATDDVGCRPVTLWRHGWFDHLPSCIDHALVGVAWDYRPEGRGAVLVMRDVGAWLVPEGDGELPLEAHLSFIDHMAQLHAAYWGWRDTIGLLPLTRRFTWFGPHLARAEQARGGTDLVPTKLVPEGWARLASRAPRTAEVAFALHEDPAPLIGALASTPKTLVHGDWKLGNLGRYPDGRTILLDWAIPGIAPACADIAHYICLNQARLPHSKDAALDAHREALERHGVDTSGWWDRQLGLCLLGILLLFGWEKALGGDEELAWWQARAAEGIEEL